MKICNRLASLLAVALLTFASAVPAATFNLFSPASGILKGNPSTYVTTAATSADIIATFTGTCNSSSFLRGDGQCITISVSSISLVDGTVGTPSLNFISETGTGLYRPSAGILGVSILGTQRARFSAADILFDPTGQVTVDANLQVNTGGAVTSNTLQANAGQDLTLASPTGIVNLRSNGTNWVTIDGTGTVRVNGSAGTNGQVLTSGGVGAAASWTTVSGGGSGANPTALVGLSAVNGASGNFIRSDGAPALDQGIAPTWTSRHIFSLASTGTNGDGAVATASARPTFSARETDASADNRTWLIGADGEQFLIQTINDGNTVVGNAVIIDRTGTTVDGVKLPAKDAAIGASAFSPEAAANRGSLFINGSTDSILSFGNGGSTAGYIYADANNLRLLGNTGRGVAFYTNGASVGSIDTAGVLTINGSGITALNAGNISTGTLAVARGGTGTTTSTGTGSVVLSASPTFTGTLTGATGAFTTLTSGGQNVCRANGVNCPSYLYRMQGGVFTPTSNVSCSFSGSFNPANTATPTATGDCTIGWTTAYSAGTICTATPINNSTATATVVSTTTTSARVQVANSAGTLSAITTSVVCFGIN